MKLKYTRTYNRRRKKGNEKFKFQPPCYCKAAGTDGIHPELINYRRNNLLNRMYELVRQILEEEIIPKEYKETIYKKGERDRCENYRGME